eukprot:NODE_2166_length_1273_cov_32.965686_g1970_i0.p1 GENE.NODE_2166_length_1273_cov_32.965686_g1970_i0~~NODE_2166_length_1273_cov_32.965686_g1970_i0.p1  ORF type:complete len:327 (-),score=53.83 NODE_2166_length_1273_cov_32.965686_g1970_i0:292-1209(-)
MGEKGIDALYAQMCLLGWKIRRGDNVEEETLVETLTRIEDYLASGDCADSELEVRLCNALQPVLASSEPAALDVAARIYALLTGQGGRWHRIGTSSPESHAGISVRMREVGMAGVGVGGRLWPSAPFLSERLLDGAYEACGVTIAGSRVVELGCGACPFPGIVCAKLGAASVTVTDSFPCQGLMDAAEQNVRFNLEADKVQVERLAWDAIDGRWKGSADVILAADVVYDPEHPHLLPQACAYILDGDSYSAVASRVIVVVAERAGIEGITSFEDEMQKLGFETIRRVSAPPIVEFVFGWADRDAR